MNVARSSLTLLLTKAAVVTRTSLCEPRTVLHLSRTMASPAQGNMKPTHKNARRLTPLRHVKLKETRSQASSAQGPTHVCLQVVGAGSRANPASLYVFSGCNSYLFNCGEGTQRLMQEHKLKMKRLNQIFLTRMSWENVGGLSGLILTLRDYGMPKCFLSGPPQLKKYLKALKSFTGQLEGIELLVRPYTEETYKDDTMVVHQVPVFAQSSSSPEHVTDSRGHPANQGGKRKDASLLMAFICRVNPKKGKLMVEKAMELGFPLGSRESGELINKLKNGESITYKGKQIQPEQLITPAEPSPVFIVVECPSEEFVKPVCENQQLERFHSGGTEDAPTLVVHMTPESILNTDRYQEWMKRFPAQTEHLLVNGSVDTTHHLSSHKLQTHLNMIHPHIFPQLHPYRNEDPAAALQVSTVRAECCLKFQFRNSEWQRDAIPVCSTDHFLQLAAEIPDFVKEAEQCRRTIGSATRTFPEVVFLGTGSAVPSKTRNVSSTLVNISPSRSLLLDCGEGTYGQLCRHYGDDVDEALIRISTVFVSHVHADHHTGLVKLLLERSRALATSGRPVSPVFLLAPVEIMDWLQQYNHHCEEVLSHINYISNRLLLERASPGRANHLLVGKMLQQNQLQQFQTCFVPHGRNESFACSFTHQSGWKVAFSGDTMPCRDFVHIGRNASLLIHEATLEDGMEDMASLKQHSTTSQAISIGMQMNADFIMLNHFSQRYPKIPVFSKDFSERVGISFDHMRVCLSDLKTVPKLTPALKTLFSVEIELLKERSERKERKFGDDASLKQGLKRDPEPDMVEEKKRLKTS